MDDFTWDRERHDFIDTLRKASIETLVVTNQSTGLMETCTATPPRAARCWGFAPSLRRAPLWRRAEEQIMGIRFKLN